MKYFIKLVPSLDNVVLPHGDGDAPPPIAPPRCLELIWKKFQRLYLNYTTTAPLIMEL